ncbi:helix-turn-helix domain-containing protein [Streptomyces sp. NPDC057474]|uniref:helix-turn-helix domain-containing protein n=1 Tax=Streptomyces sp. NPDC057474 TaxID=3346144 RepID=UPI0036885A81
MTNHLAALAANVRRLREIKGLSLSQLSERAGVAKATLFKIEQGQTNPTLDTLATIANALDVSLTELVATPEGPAVEVIRAGEKPEFVDEVSRGLVLRNQVIGAGNFEIHSLVFLNDKREVTPSHGAGAREHVLVRSGRVQAGPLGEEVVLGEGDYATFPADRAHLWHAIDGDASVWLICTYPRPATFTEH